MAIFASGLLAACGTDSITSQDASTDAARDAMTDAQSKAVAACGDAGYFITVVGDGTSRLLQSNQGVPNVTTPASSYSPPCERLFVIGGSESPDGGAVVFFQISSDSSPPPAPTEPATLVYERGDGTYFASSPTNGQPTFSKLEDPGGVVAGSYALTVTSADAGSLSLSGAFCTLRLPDDAPTNCPP